MPTFDGGFPIDDDGDIELFEVPHKRRTEVDSPKHNQSDLLPESQAQATPSHEHLFWGLDKLPRRPLSRTTQTKRRNTTTTLVCEDEIMTDTIAELTEKGFVKLPSLRQVLPRGVHAPEPEENIDRPYYNEYYHCEGFVAWWDNKTGKGMIIDHRNKFEHKIELKDIKYSNYGALVSGSMVEYEYSDDGIRKGFSKFWVVSGCEYVLWKDAWADEKKYLYMREVKQEHYERQMRGM